MVIPTGAGAASPDIEGGTEATHFREIVLKKIATSVRDNPSGKHLIEQLDIGGKLRVKELLPSPIAGAEHHPAEFSPHTGHVVGEKDFGAFSFEDWLKQVREWAKDSKILSRAETAYLELSGAPNRSALLFGRPVESPVFDFCLAGQKAYLRPARLIRIRAVDYPLWMIADAFDFPYEVIEFFVMDPTDSLLLDEDTVPFSMLDGSRELDDAEIETASVCWLEFLRKHIISKFPETTWKEQLETVPKAHDVYQYWASSPDYRARLHKTTSRQ